MIYSGLDWSGNPGPAYGASIVFAVIHVDDDDLPGLEHALAEAAARLKWPRDFVFKHSGAKPIVHDEFYRALRHVAFRAHVHVLDKASWQTQYGGKRSRGDDCICDGISSLLLRCPERATSDQILYIDLPHKERTTIKKYRAAIRSSLVGADRRNFRHIKARPDNRRDGGIIQIADMIAGEVAEHDGPGGPYLPSVGSRIVLV